MIVFNGRKYAMLGDKSHEGDGVAINGFYQKHRNFWNRHRVDRFSDSPPDGYKLYGLDGELEAFISTRPGAKMVVDAGTHDVGGGRLVDRFMQSTSTLTEEWLGLPQYAKEDVLIDAIQNLERFSLMVNPNPNRDDLDQTPVQCAVWASNLEAAIEQAAADYPGCRVLGLEGATGDINSFSVSWMRRNVHRTVSDVAWWRDESSPHDPYVLRVLYAANGRKLGGPMVGEPGEMDDWHVVPGSVAFDQDRKATQKNQDASILEALESLGWMRSDGAAIATKTFDTVNNEDKAAAYLTKGDGYSRTLQFTYVSEGRNVAEADSVLIPVGASEDQASKLAMAAATRAEKSIQESYGVRIEAMQSEQPGGFFL